MLILLHRLVLAAHNRTSHRSQRSRGAATYEIQHALILGRSAEGAKIEDEEGKEDPT